MNIIRRDRHLTPEEADKYDRVRELIEQEFPPAQRRFDAEKERDMFLIFLERNGLTKEQLETQIVFDKMIFMGAGDPYDLEKNFTGQNVAALRYMLETAMSHIGGMQQRRHPDEQDLSANIAILLQNINNALSWPKDENS